MTSLQKDVVQRNNVRDVDLLSRIIAYVMANAGMTFSATSLSKFFRNEQRTASVESILNFMKYCMDALAVNDLPQLHRDPFDRILLAQAKVEGISLLTSDSALQEYPVPVILVPKA